MKVKFRFDLRATIDDVEIEADSVEEALSKLYKQDAETLLKAGVILESDVENETMTVIEKHYKVKAYDIDYEVTAEDVDDGTDLTDSELEARIKAVKESLPKELVFEIDAKNEEELEELLVDEISNETNWLVRGYQFMIIEER